MDRKAEAVWKKLGWDSIERVVSGAKRACRSVVSGGYMFVSGTGCSDHYCAFPVKRKVIVGYIGSPRTLRGAELVFWADPGAAHSASLHARHLANFLLHLPVQKSTNQGAKGVLNFINPSWVTDYVVVKQGCAFRFVTCV
jgi:hypothetical protein